ncbi:MULTISPECIES: ZrgA family zinc uptake protein, partial [unclassified Neptuniibacter]
MIRNVLALCLGVSAALVSVNAAAFEQHEAHVHGEAVLNIVVEGGNIEAHFQSPQMNLTGFEHQAETAADKGLLAQTLVKLQDTSALINLPDQAQCKGVKVAANNSDIVLDDSFKEEHADEHEHEH